MRMTERMRDWVIDQYEERTAVEIAKDLRIKPGTLRNYLHQWKKLGYYKGKNGCKNGCKRGDNRPKDLKLDDDKQLILDLLDSDEPVVNIAKSFSVAPYTLYKALHRWGAVKPKRTSSANCVNNKALIIAHIEAGGQHQVIADRVDTDLSTLQRWLRKWRAEGSLAPGNYISSDDKRYSRSKKQVKK